MSEQPQPQQYGIDPETMEVIPIEIEATQEGIEAEYASYTHEVIEDIRTASTEGPVKRYAEIHLVDGQGVLMIPRANPGVYGASVGGNHSYTDELRHFPDVSEKDFAHLSGELDLSIGTIVAKGTVSAHNGLVSLSVEDIRKKGEGAAWLRDIQKQSELFGIDGGTTVDLKYEKQENAVKLEDLQTKYHVHPHVKTGIKFDESVPQNKDRITGIITDIRVEEPMVRLGHDNSVSEFASVSVDAQDGHSVLHAPLYDQAGFSPDNPAGFIGFELNGKPVQMGIRYSVDGTSRRINIFYAQDYGDEVQSLQESIIKSFRGHIFPYTSEETTTHVTVSIGNNVPSSHEVSENKSTAEGVKRINEQEGQEIRTAKDIEFIVEKPAQAAVRTLWDKNIATVSSSANAEQDTAYVTIDFSTLSTENQSIALELNPGLLQEAEKQGTKPVAKLGIDITPSTPVALIEEKLTLLADSFVPQDLTWAPVYTLSELKKVYGYSETEKISAADFAREGYYYDTTTERFYLSEEIYRKQKDTA